MASSRAKQNSVLPLPHAVKNYTDAALQGDRSAFLAAQLRVTVAAVR